MTQGTGDVAVGELSSQADPGAGTHGLTTAGSHLTPQEGGKTIQGSPVQGGTRQTTQNWRNSRAVAAGKAASRVSSPSYESN
jgi:hypothetical protein